MPLPLLIVIVIVFSIIASAVRVLKEYERGVIFRLGRLIDTKGPGLILLIPVIDKMQKVSLRLIALDVPPQVGLLLARRLARREGPGETGAGEEATRPGGRQARRGNRSPERGEGPEQGHGALAVEGRERLCFVSAEDVVYEDVGGKK